MTRASLLFSCSLVVQELGVRLEALKVRTPSFRTISESRLPVCRWQWVGCLLVACQVGRVSLPGWRSNTDVHPWIVCQMLSSLEGSRSAFMYDAVYFEIDFDPFTYRELSDCSSHWLKEWIHLILLFFCSQRSTWLFKYSHKVASKSSLVRFCFCLEWLVEATVAFDGVTGQSCPGCNFACIIFFVNVSARIIVIQFDNIVERAAMK